MNKLITRDRYKDLDPDVAEALRSGKQVLGEDIDGKRCWLVNYGLGEAQPYWVVSNQRYYDGMGIRVWNPIREPEEKPGLTPDENTPRDTLCEVWDEGDEEHPYYRYYAGLSDNGEPLFWTDGATSRTCEPYEIEYIPHVQIIEYPDGTKP